MRTLSILTLAILLTACGHQAVKPEETVVERVEYVIKVPPAQMMQLPSAPKTVDVDDPKMMQSDVSRWSQSREDYIIQLENKLIGIAKFFMDEQSKLDEKAKQENSK